MSNFIFSKAQQMLQAPPEQGELRIVVVSEIGLIPVVNATVTISYTGEPSSPLMTLTTDENGQTPLIDLPAPALEYSLTPEQLVQPYSEYNITVTADGYEPVLVSGTEILPHVTAIQPIRLTPLEEPSEAEEDIIIPAHTLFYEYPPKIPEDEIKPMPESGEIVLSRVVIPEYVIVHDGVPADSTASNYYVRYKDYIKKHQGIVSEDIAIKVTLAVLAALTDIHKAGIIHRDIAPDNVFILKNGTIKLSDFGAARFPRTDKEIDVVLKPGFAPAEQYQRDGKQGPYTDIYAVGAMLYRAVTGIMPPEATNRRKEECLIPPKEINHDISDNLNNIILRAMAMQPKLRFQTAEEFRNALVGKR